MRFSGLGHCFQVKSESLSRKNELDEISERVEDKKLVMGNMLMQAKVVEEHAKTKEEHLGTEIKSLLISGTSLSVARKRIWVICNYNCFIGYFFIYLESCD